MPPTRPTAPPVTSGTGRSGCRPKERLAALTGLPAADHALIGSASEGIARALSAIDWRPGDNVVVSALDYASGRHSMLRLGQLGVEPRIVPGRGWRIEPADLLAACDARTRAVYVSQVTSLTGQRVDVAALAAGLPQGTMLIVDASHALGVVPVDGRLARRHGVELLQVPVRHPDGRAGLEPGTPAGLRAAGGRLVLGHRHRGPLGLPAAPGRPARPGPATPTTWTSTC